MISRWAPGLISTPSLPPEKSGVPAQPSPASVQAAAAEPTSQQATPASPATAQTSAPMIAPPSPELAQLLQTMIGILSNVEQGVQELKVGQERMSGDNARIVEQLRASQEQMTRLLARTSDQNPGLRTSAPLTPAPAPAARPITSPARNAAPTRSSPQARAQPRVPVQLDPEEQ
jgi:hypothetical protein